MYIEYNPKMAYEEAVRFNMFANTAQEAYGCSLPFSVRYGAAKAADEVIQKWIRDILPNDSSPDRHPITRRPSYVEPPETGS